MTRALLVLVTILPAASPAGACVLAPEEAAVPVVEGRADFSAAPTNVQYVGPARVPLEEIQQRLE